MDLFELNVFLWFFARVNTYKVYVLILRVI